MPQAPATTTIQVNGAARPWREGLTVAGLLAELRAAAAGVAVERNGAVIRRADWERTVLAPGDVVEIVALVGGG
ncbi:MAG: sulfur carrier protein ThiS [Planctomycetota bacterium]|nr:MAG: sulfur carrier protein ThiS [Planctomycetota bacterium]